MPTTLAKPKSFPVAPRCAVMRAVMRSCAFVLAVNWVMQGMRGMDGKELAFRLLAEAALAGGLAAMLLAGGMAAGPAWLLAAALAHSLGFTVNGQFWVCARYCPSYRGDMVRLHRFLGRSAEAVARAGWLDEAVVIGSTGEGALGPRSDIDLRLICPRGVVAWIRTNLLLLRLRTAAFLGGVPLDAYAYDRVDSLRRFDPAEPWVVLLDRRGRIAAGFPGRLLTGLA